MRSMRHTLLGEMLWKKLFHHLSPASKCCPPTACQVLLYSQSLGSRIGAHQDVKKNGKEKGSQLSGTSVIVFSLYDEMEFDLRPVSNKKGGPSSTVLLSHQSVHVLNPRDDERFYHSAKFPSKTKPGSVRVAYVFRWLTDTADFYCGKNDGPRQHAMAEEEAYARLQVLPSGKLLIGKLNAARSTN